MGTKLSCRSVPYSLSSELWVTADLLITSLPAIFLEVLVEPTWLGGPLFQCPTVNYSLLIFPQTSRGPSIAWRLYLSVSKNQLRTELSWARIRPSVSRHLEISFGLRGPSPQAFTPRNYAPHPTEMKLFHQMQFNVIPRTPSFFLSLKGTH